MDTICVVVPTYNQAKYLPACLDSIWFQDYPDLEIIVVNDGSTDDTAAALEDYAKSISEETTSYASNYNERTKTVERVWQNRFQKEGRTLVVIHNPANQGLSCALNAGFKAATAEYCTFIASDDMLLSSMCSTLHDALLENKADFAYADMHIINDEGRILRKFALPAYSFQNAFCAWYLCGICKLYKLDLHRKHGFYSPDHVSQDHEMYLRFAMGGAKFVHVPKVLANVRIHDRDRRVDNHSAQKESEQILDSIALVLKARAFKGGGQG